MPLTTNGGKGSGNFGHEGRPGQVGGSGDGDGSSVESKVLTRLGEKAQREAADAMYELTGKEKKEAIAQYSDASLSQLTAAYFREDATPKDRGKLLYAVDRIYTKSGKYAPDPGDVFATDKKGFEKGEGFRRRDGKEMKL